MQEITDISAKLQEYNEHIAKAEKRLKKLKADFKANSDNFYKNLKAPVAVRKAIAQEADAIQDEIQKVETELQAIKDAKRKLEAEQAERERQLEEEKRKAEQLASEREKAEKERKAKETAKAKVDAELSKLKGKKTSVDRLNTAAEKILDTLKVQIMPSTICVEPNDAFMKGLFRFGEEKYKQALQGKKFGVQEKRKTKKKDAIWSKLSIKNAEGYENDSPLSEFDRAVLGVLISEYLWGNRYTTINIVFRALVGKVGIQNSVLHKNQKDAIINSVLKLMGTLADFSGVSESLKEMKYTDKEGNEVFFQYENLVSASIINAKVNGQAMDGVIHFKENSPLFDIANAKDQVIRYHHELLNVPKQNNTPLVISLKKYVMRRICEIKLHKNLTPTITFDDIFAKCRLGEVDKHRRKDARNNVIKFLEHLKSKEFIKSYEVCKHGNSIHGVKFIF